MKNNSNEHRFSIDAKRRAGFTLVEMLVVLALIALVSTLVITNVIDSLESGKINTARSWVNGPGKAAVTTYYIQAGYPTTLDALLTPPPGGKTAVVEKASGLLDPWKKKYQYTHPGQRNPGSFDLWTTAPDGTEIGNWDPSTGP
jgi:general secretion pathway protein G